MKSTHPRKISYFCLLIILLICASVVSGQRLILYGQVRDAQSGQPLAAANVQIIGTPFGTISNHDGSFQLAVTPPATIRFSYIGYDSHTLSLDALPAQKIDIKLAPAAIDMGQLTISAVNPAVQIMKKMLARKQTMREQIRSFSATAYHRLNVQNDSAVVLIIENISRLFWQAGRGSREIFGQLTQTTNLPALRQGVGVSDIPNFYDDDILLGRYSFIGPAHPKVFDFYKVSLTGRNAMDGRIIYEIQITPKTRQQPLFEGSLSIQDSSFALMSVELSSADLPRQNLLQDFHISIKQQFREITPGVWLPADWHEKGRLQVGMTGLQFPTIHYVRLASLDDFHLNVPVPDSLFHGERRLAPHDSTLLLAQRGVPLTFEEEWAYKTIDSTMTLMQAFKPRGFLAKMVKFDVRANDQSLSKGDSSKRKSRWQLQHRPMAWFNRVDAFHLGWNGRLSRGAWALQSGAAYRTGLKKGAYQAELAYIRGWACVTWGYKRETQVIAAVPNYTLLLNSAPVLLGYRDYYDYFQTRGWRGSVEWTNPKRQLAAVAFLAQEKHASLHKTSDFDLTGNDNPQRDNPAIDPGMWTAAGLRFAWGQPNPSLAAGANGIEIEYEQGLKDFLQGHFSYARYSIRAGGRVETFLRRQPIPAALDLHLLAGTTTGDVPLQKTGGLPGALGVWSPFGTFHTLRGGSVYADKYAALFWEHNFRAWPFDLLGWRFPGEKGLNLLLHGGHGRIWKSPISGGQPTYHELGLSLSGLFSYARLDVSRRLGAAGFWCMSLSVAKFI